jgi:hypothetical protein
MFGCWCECVDSQLKMHLLIIIRGIRGKIEDNFWLLVRLCAHKFNEEECKRVDYYLRLKLM